jgi:regulator of protease activity HflC (stomatin/prohibitin superfamily)
MAPGVRIYWPVTTEIEIIVAARQTLNLATQALTTADGHTIAIGALVVYRIRDVVRAIGARNWDVDTTVADIGLAAVTSVIAKSSLAELRDIDAIEERLTQACRRQLKRYGVSVQRTRITDLAPCRIYRILGDSPPGLAKHDLHGV